jgi:crossover junction endodeoxyribonuclease RuvC
MREAGAVITIGIDPGVSGAIVRLDESGVSLICDMPTVDINGRKHIDEYGVRAALHGTQGTVIIEHVQGIQQSGATSAFNFGTGWGLIRGVVCGLGIPSQLVRPQRWTKDLAVGRDKGEHRAMASRLWPDAAGLFARVKDDGRADAALLAWWFARQSMRGVA